jgi:predicted DNA-binding ribbon-helix-helix protein
MHDHITSGCIVLHKFTANLACKLERNFQHVLQEITENILLLDKVVAVQLIDKVHTSDRLSFNNYRNVLKLAVQYLRNRVIYSLNMKCVLI